MEKRSHRGRSYGKTALTAPNGAQNAVGKSRQPRHQAEKSLLLPRTSPFVWLLFATALLVRIVFLMLPAFSTDPLRFLSDGINLLEGRNPYTAPPVLEVPYGHLRSFYPPLMELFFAFAAALSQNPAIFRWLGGAAELVFLSWFFYRKRAKPIPRILVLFLLFNPLSLHEIWREGHLDHIGGFLLYFAILTARPRLGRGYRQCRAYFFTLLAIAWKFVGVFTLLFRLRRGGSSPLQRVWVRLSDRFSVVTLLFFALQFVPAYFFTPFAERGLTVYLRYWHHGNGIVHWLHGLGFAEAHGVYLVQRAIFLLLFIISLLYIVKRLSHTNAIVVAVGSLLVLFPVQHPWYYFLLFPFILLYRRWRGALIALCFLAPLSYLGYLDQAASLGFWVLLALWLGVLMVHFAGAQRRIEPKLPGLHTK